MISNPLLADASHMASCPQRFIDERNRVRTLIQEKRNKAARLDSEGKRLEAAEIRKSARVLAALWRISL